MGEKNFCRLCSALLLAVLTGIAPGGFAVPQTNSSAASSTEAKVDRLESELSVTKQELSRSREEIEGLRRELDAIKSQLPVSGTAADPDKAGMYPTLGNVQSGTPTGTSPNQEQQDELAARVAEQAQTKVESASRYRVRLSGLVLMNTYSNIGHVDVTDLPSLAFARVPGQSHGDFGATLRQTLLGLEVNGPHVGGAATSADLQADFFGGFPETNFGVTAGLFRLRTASIHLDWAKTNIEAGQDGLFFSPLSPTSYATVGEPALSWAGNLWVWTPQVRLEHQFSVSDTSAFLLQGGVLDALTEQIPPEQFNRVPSPAEAAKKPGIAARSAWMGRLFGRNACVGIGGYYARQDYGFSRAVDSWAGTTDWTVPLGSRLTLTGEFSAGAR